MYKVCFILRRNKLLERDFFPLNLLNFFVKFINSASFAKMPTEVKQRKKSQKIIDEVSETSSVNRKNDVQKEKTEAGKNVNKTYLDFRTILCLLSLAACGVLSW